MRPRRPGGPGDGAPRHLNATLGTATLTLLVVGDILGAGIYVLVGEVADDLGGLLWAPFLVAFAMASLTALSYAELVCAHPHAGGSAHYVQLAFGRPALTFLVGFVVTASAISTAAAVSLAVGTEYLGEYVDVPASTIAVTLVAVLSVVVWVGVRESAIATVTMTAIEVTGLVLVITAGVVGVAGGDGNVGNLTDAGGDWGATALLGAAALAFFAYLGFEDLVHLSEEVRDPRRSFPIALLGGLGVVGALYLGVTLSVGLLVDPAGLRGSGNPLLEVLEFGPVPPGLFSAIAVFAVTNTALIALTTASRQVYGLAEDGSIPRRLGHVSRRGTPDLAIVGVAAVVATLAVTGGVRVLAGTTVVLLLGVFTTVNVVVLVLRRSPRPAPDDVDPGGRRPFRTPTPLPVLGALGCGALWVDALVRGGWPLLARLAALLALGAVLYGLARWRGGAEGAPGPDAPPADRP